MSKSNAKLNERVVGFLSSHPYLSVFALCMLAHVFTFVNDGLVPKNSNIMLTIIIGIFAVLAVKCLYNPNEYAKINKPTLMVLTGVGVLILAYLYYLSDRNGLFNLIGGFLLVLVLCFMLRGIEDKEKLIVILIIGLSFILKFYYVYKTSMYVRQHDLGGFDEIHGHLSYIQYIYENKKIPSFDPRPYWQYYHPPLHHIISAIWMFINKDVFGTGINPAREGIQTLTLFYSMVIVITAYKLLKHFKLKGMALYTPLIIVAFHPAFILLSGSVNNDVLSVALIMLSVLFTVEWVKAPTFKNIIKIAFSVGLAMMAKISAAVVAIPIAIVFLMVFIKNYKSKGKLLVGQYATLGAISIPLGLGYQIRNYSKFGVPITYVQELSKDIDQYLGEGNFISRITDFSFYQFKTVFLSWDWWEYAGYNETNPLIALMKTALFEETIREGTFPHGIAYVIAATLFWLSVIIAAVAFVSMVVVLIRKCTLTVYEKVLLGVFWLATMISYYKMAYDYPFVCTISFRYVSPVIILGAIFIGVCMEKLKERESKGVNIACKVMLGASIAFAALSTIAYTIISGI